MCAGSNQLAVIGEDDSTTPCRGGVNGLYARLEGGQQQSKLRDVTALLGDG